MEDSDNMMNLEPIRMLELFPVRKTKCLQFDLDKYKKLFEALSCTFCQQIFNSPTYLRCSHRFCKECIEKHIRINDKKSCPICRAELTTKRDTKSDFGLNSLISFSFGEANSLQNDIDKINEEATKNFRFVKTKTGIQMEMKRERSELADSKIKQLEVAPRKRLKRDKDEAEKSDEENKINLSKDKLIKQEPIEPKKMISEEAEAPKKEALLIDVVEPNEEGESLQKRQKVKPLSTMKTAQMFSVGWSNSKQKGTKKKKAEIIEIHSQNSNQLQLNAMKPMSFELNIIPENHSLKMDPLMKETRVGKEVQQIKKIRIVNEVKEGKEIVEIEQIKSIPESKANKQTKQAKENKQRQENKQVKQIKQLRNQIQLTKNQKKQRTESQFFRDFKVNSNIIQIRKKLKQQIGQNYLRSLVMKSKTKCTLKLKLLPYKNCKWTPMLEKELFEISVNMTMRHLVDFVLRKLNLAKFCSNEAEKLMELSLENKQSESVVIDNRELTVLDLLEKYWKDYKGIGIFNLKNSLSHHPNGHPGMNASLLSSLFKQGESQVIPASTNTYKTLYYKVNVAEMWKAA